VVELSPATREALETLFHAQTDEAAELLRTECSDNLPLWVDTTPEGLERIRFAVLKLSNGDIPELRRHIKQAQVDWRDVLVAAGFGHDPAAHRGWMP